MTFFELWDSDGIPYRLFVRLEGRDFVWHDAWLSECCAGTWLRVVNLYERSLQLVHNSVILP